MIQKALVVNILSNNIEEGIYSSIFKKTAMLVTAQCDDGDDP